MLRTGAKKKMQEQMQKQDLTWSKNFLIRQRSRVKQQLCAKANSSKRERPEKRIKDIEKQLQKSFDLELELRALDSIQLNSNYFFSYASKHSNIQSLVGPIQDGNGMLVSNPWEVAELVKEQYELVFSVLKPNMALDDPEELFENCSQRLILLKKCGISLATPLYILWRKSVDSGQIPSILKQAILSPIHKGGSRGIAQNYHPVALTSHLIKLPGYLKKSWEAILWNLWG